MSEFPDQRLNPRVSFRESDSPSARAGLSFAPTSMLGHSSKKIVGSNCLRLRASGLVASPTASHHSSLRPLPKASGRGASHTPTQDTAFLLVCLISALSSVQRGRRSRPEQPQPSALVPGDRSLRGHHEGRLGSPRVQQKRAPRPHPPETSLTAEPRSRQVCGR
ncbi:unnamed protein product [Rangifer tarandus platyrhynchus]|uniref:Uncharacterized protein n=1 Tax=Rangifer tarandus platyrhynchus TaxID=3082113 RepID=A0ABN8ZCH0_RANTA|nr:unnamed protein product [Rangifer tarandus platyrhynchus]